MGFFKRNKLLLVGIATGLICGFLYWHFAGCTGGCTITSKPLNSTLYGGMMGGVLFSAFKKQ